MRNKHFVFLGLLLIGLQAIAQKTFTGYYINIQGDTTRVSFSGYRQWANNPQQIQVRTAGGEQQVLTPENTRQVTIEGFDTYMSRRFTRLTNPYDLFDGFNTLSAVDSTEEIKGFLLFLTESKGVSLYKYSDKKRNNYFIETADSLVELYHKAYLTEYNKELATDNRFRQQLWAAFNLDATSSAALKNRLERLPYSEDQLKAFFRQTEDKKANRQKLYPPDMVVMGGVAYNTFDVTAKDFSNGSILADYAPNLSPVVGVALYEYSQRNFARNFLTLQLKYYHYKNRGDYSYYGRQETVTYQAHVLNLGVGLGRNLVNKPALKVYTAAVPTLLCLLDNLEQDSYREKSDKESLFTYNVSLQAGGRLAGRLGFWAHYNLMPTDVKTYSFINNNHRTLQVGVDWKLKQRSKMRQGASW